MQPARCKPRYGRFPAGLLGMLALAAAVEAFVSRHELDAVAPDDWQYLLARRSAARQALGRDLLILGDSQAKFGVLPKVIGARSRLPSYNLAISGAQAPTSYEVLRLALGGGARPTAVVVDFKPFLLAIHPRSSRGGLSFLLSYGESVRLSWLSRDPVFLANLLVHQALPSLRCRTGLRAWVRANLEGRTNRNRLLMPEALNHWTRNDGALVVPSMPGRPVSEIDQQRRLYPPGWTPDRANADYVHLFLRLAEANGVTVYWLMPPVHPAVQAANEAAGFDERYVAFVRAQQRRFPGLVVLDGRHAGYDPAVFLDPTHLGREGAFALSQDLGDVLLRLDRATAPGRWVALPRYRPRATDPEILAARLDVFLPESAPSATR